jgi:hypothetical protein
MDKNPLFSNLINANDQSNDVKTKNKLEIPSQSLINPSYPSFADPQGQIQADER